MKFKVNDIQKYSDGIINKLFLWAIPRSVTPNNVTIVRLILIPVIYLLIQSSMIWWGLAVFIFAACTDFIDGAMARTRNQVTDLGTALDPIADKLLIITVLICVGSNYLIVQVFVVFIVLELIITAAKAFFSFAKDKPIGANIFGKIKMILQSFSVMMFIIGTITNNQMIINISAIILTIALIFAVLSGLEHARRHVNKTIRIKI